MEQLKKRLAKGETEAFVDLYDLVGVRLLRYLTARLNATDAQDVLQEVFVRLVRYHRRLAKSKNLTAYVFLTARNEANRWVGKSTGQNDNHEMMLNVPVDQLPIGARIEQEELANRLLSHLDAETRDIVQLKIYSGLTFPEVAKIVGLPDSTVATKYRRGILKMQSAGADGRNEATETANKQTTDRVIR